LEEAQRQVEEEREKRGRAVEALRLLERQADRFREAAQERESELALLQEEKAAAAAAAAALDSAREVLSTLPAWCAASLLLPKKRA